MPLDLWVEKYRPQKLDDVINQKHVVDRLRVWVSQGSIPNMMFAGSAGVGKTTIALALAKEIFGTHWKENFSETNASDERGIDVVRGKIKEFARTRPLGADFKIVFLDEADALTPEAQQALRRTIEKYANVCRFILSCNYSSRIIEPIQSRCVVFRFKGLTKPDVEKYIEKIVNSEKMKIDQKAIDAIVNLSEGDLRKVANLLQACSTHKDVTEDLVYEISSQVKPDEIRQMLNGVLGGGFEEARKQLFNLLINQGLSGEDILKSMHKELFGLQIDEKAKVDLLEKIGEYEFRLNQGGTPEIQLLALLAQFLKYKK
ncbi:MAG: replication factor C small subunit, partial [Candidatus Aenigmarchaeota archaeon]|nr:replication factor C small subunit [Candidatus Aenigmarchaeota archaeon]